MVHTVETNIVNLLGMYVESNMEYHGQTCWHISDEVWLFYNLNWREANAIVLGIPKKFFSDQLRNTHQVIQF